MKKGRKLFAALLVAAFTAGAAFTASAATASPVKGNESFDAATNTDKNTADYKNAEVQSVVKGSSAAVKTVKSVDTKNPAKTVTLTIARDAQNKAINITAIGNGSAGVFNSKAGRVVTKLVIKSKAKKVTIKKNAFKKSKVKTIVIKKSVKKVQINKNAFKSTKAKKLTLSLSKASQLTVKKGALKGLKKITIKGASKKQRSKIIKKLVKAGFKKKNIK